MCWGRTAAVGGMEWGKGLTAMVWLTALGFLEVRVRFMAVTLLLCLLPVNILDVVPLKARGNYHLLSPRGLSHREAHYKV